MTRSYEPITIGDGGMEFRVVVESQRNAYHAYCPSIMGCHTWGATLEEAMAYMEEALRFYVDHMEANWGDQDHDLPPPAPAIQ